MHDNASLVRYAPPELVMHPERPIDGNIAKALNGAVRTIGWEVTIADTPGEPTLRRSGEELAVAEAKRQAVLDHPIVRAAIASLPGLIR